MRHTYGFTATPSRIVIGSSLHLSPTSIGEVIGGALVHQFSRSPNDTYALDLQIQEPAHIDALGKIWMGLQGLGFSFLEAQVAEWVAMSAELGTVGFFGGGSIAGAKTRSLGAAVLVGICGGVVGAAAGQILHRQVAAYRAQLAYGQWQLTALELPPTPVIRAFSQPAWGQAA